MTTVSVRLTSISVCVMAANRKPLFVAVAPGGTQAESGENHSSTSWVPPIRPWVSFGGVELCQ